MNENQTKMLKVAHEWLDRLLKEFNGPTAGMHAVLVVRATPDSENPDDALVSVCALPSMPVEPLLQALEEFTTKLRAGQLSVEKGEFVDGAFIPDTNPGDVTH